MLKDKNFSPTHLNCLTKAYKIEKTCRCFFNPYTVIFLHHSDSSFTCCFFPCSHYSCTYTYPNPILQWCVFNNDSLVNIQQLASDMYQHTCTDPTGFAAYFIFWFFLHKVSLHLGLFCPSLSRYLLLCLSFCMLYAAFKVSVNMVKDSARFQTYLQIA